MLCSHLSGQQELRVLKRERILLVELERQVDASLKQLMAEEGDLLKRQSQREVDEYGHGNGGGDADGGASASAAAAAAAAAGAESALPSSAAPLQLTDQQPPADAPYDAGSGRSPKRRKKAAASASEVAVPEAAGDDAFARDLEALLEG
ncbi:unnamed protein product [Vitrella brassicaformis CCMP3155]|uniref:Uncharacterized protein n=1 Tax=Vitrella brassicaformis (strain CCMP3155) TaxID=1169540 RepID=A0A0G4FFI6_VITBC|nr:unnamed protein product [Vitrella brassicaformis CCMP3155]|eukprot:CEM11956.1 unnamed protein product [Vitrella brassicaformis CCMP3155]